MLPDAGLARFPDPGDPRDVTAERRVRRFHLDTNGWSVPALTLGSAS